MTWRAHIRHEPLARHVDIYVVDELGNGVEVFGPGGQSVQFVAAGVAADNAEPTLRLPEHALPALLGTLSAHLGAVEHPQQLRKDYEAERARVDRLIDLATRPPLVVGGPS